MEQVRRAARGTVLVVSNTPDVASGLVGRLRVAEIEVLRTARCIEAIALAAVVAPELVVVDACLPGARTLCAQLAATGRAGQALLVLVREGATVDLPEGCEVVRFDATASDTVLRRAETLVAEGRDLRAASPLTGLPGNAAIRLELERRFASGPVALLYVDIDGFKPFNDHYGFLRGDEVLRTVAGLLDREARRRPGTFVGHVGGDDFVLFTAPDDAAAIAAAIVAAFDAAVPALYDPEDAASGYIEAEDRQGQRLRCPLLSISVGVATTLQREVSDPLALVDVATEMKHVAKQKPGSAVAVDRRVEARAERAARWHGSVRAWSRRVAVAAAAALVLALPGVAVAAAAAGPGDRMWPAGRLLEEARLALAGDERPALHAALAGARLADLVEALTAGDEEGMALAAFEFARHVAEAADDPAQAPQVGAHALLLERLEAGVCGAARRTGSCGPIALALRAAEAAADRQRPGRAPGQAPADAPAGPSGVTEAGLPAQDARLPASGDDERDGEGGGSGGAQEAGGGDGPVRGRDTPAAPEGEADEPRGEAPEPGREPPAGGAEQRPQEPPAAGDRDGGKPPPTDRGVGKPDRAKPDAAKPDAAKPDAAKPDAGAADGGGPGGGGGRERPGG